MKIKFSHMLEDMTGLVCMGLGVRGGGEEVVHIDDEPSFSDHVSKRVIHEPLKCSWRVAEAKECDHWFEESFVGDEGCFPLVSILDTNIVIPLMNIELSEVTSIL